jgi:hypothetical protein
MTRIKKSRKVGKIGVRKQDARPAKESSERKKKAPKGQRSGSRNSLLEVKPVSSGENASSAKTDPRKGSKKPIALSIAEQTKVKSPEHQAQVTLKKVKMQLSPEQELAEIENDERLIALAERVEAGELLSGKEAKFFNKMMDRHAALMAELGLEFEDDDLTDEQDFDSFGADQWDDLLQERDK